MPLARLLMDGRLLTMIRCLFCSLLSSEALQLYKTLYSRASVKKSWSEARDIVVEGATALLQQQQANSEGTRIAAN